MYSISYTQLVVLIMNCPFCKNNACTKVVDKRDTERATRRRRECEMCGKRFTTYERIDNISIKVLKRSGKIEDFDRDKLKRAVLKATSKRGVEEEAVDVIVSEIEQILMNDEKQLINSVQIGELVLKKLTKLDKLSALLFASVYKEFKSLEDVQLELERLSVH